MFRPLFAVARLTVLTLPVAPLAAQDSWPHIAPAEAAVPTFTTVKSGAAANRVWQRRADAPNWESATDLAGNDNTALKLDGLRGGDWLFGVSAIARDGSESPVASAVPGGQFAPFK